MAEKPESEERAGVALAADRLAEFPERFARAFTRIQSRELTASTPRPTRAVEAIDGWAVKLPSSP
jgi:hypothetical protein